LPPPRKMPYYFTRHASWFTPQTERRIEIQVGVIIAATGPMVSSIIQGGADSYKPPTEQYKTADDAAHANVTTDEARRKHAAI
jgi:hypothetical protein